MTPWNQTNQTKFNKQTDLYKLVTMYGSEQTQNKCN